MTFLTTLVTTFNGMQVYHQFDTSLETAFASVTEYLIDKYPDTNEIAVEAINNINTDEEIYQLPCYVNEIPNMSEPDFAYQSTNNAIEMWFRYNGGDIFVTINDVSDKVTLNSPQTP